MDLRHEVLASPTGPHDLRPIIGDRWPVKTLLEILSDHTPRRSMVPTNPLVNIEQ
jgi:hypothetical protein